jgi:hypothetical protein
MGYFDGNTTTAIWNYAQHFALNDNNYTTQFGPSTPGAINLISGQTNGVVATKNVFSSSTPPTLLHGTHEAWGDAAHTVSNITEIGDGDPLNDVCSNPNLDQVQMAGKNIGDLLNAKGITWGSFMGGFDLTVVNANGTTGCNRETNPTASGTPAFTCTTPGSSTMRRPATRPTTARTRSRRSATASSPAPTRQSRPTTTMTSTTSSMRSMRITCRR